MTLALPFATAGIAPLPFVIKQRLEDFVVEELPLYAPSGEGAHTYVEIEKRDMGTLEALGVIASRYGVSSRDIGCAGLKDSRGVTRQTLSVPGVAPERLLELQGPKLRVLSARRHVNKLRIGHLAGNRFDLRLREMPRERYGDLVRVFEVLEQRGVPNYFGEQRFGARGDSWLIGRDFLRGAYDEALAQFCGRPSALDHERVLHARRLFDEGRYREAAAAWPRGFREQIRMCEALHKNKGRARYAMRAMNQRLARFYVSAWQSHLFNAVLAARVATYDQLLRGDLAWKHANGSVFQVGDPAREAERVARVEISATGPLYGGRMIEPSGEPQEIEERVLREHAATRAEFAADSWFRPSGGRRPLRFPLHKYAASWESDDLGEHARIQFTLPPGCYATVVLREVGKEAMVHSGMEAPSPTIRDTDADADTEALDAADSG